jgi:hypothetical protein
MDDWNKLREILGQPGAGERRTGPDRASSAPTTGRQALNAWPKNDKCKAGARPVKLEVKFEGIERKEETFEYAESSWDVAKDKTKWDGVGGKRVAVKIAIRGTDNDYQLGEVTRSSTTASWSCRRTTAAACRSAATSSAAPSTSGS